jgi:hypothetical protein
LLGHSVEEFVNRIELLDGLCFGYFKSFIFVAPDLLHVLDHGTNVLLFDTKLMIVKLSLSVRGMKKNSSGVDRIYVIGFLIIFC